MKTKEFWNAEVTLESWKKLTQITKEFDFILIGGWAAYLWTKTHKSKDIDIVVDYKTLDILKQRYTLIKNERLRRYEIKEGKYDIDVYVSHYSSLTVPVEQLANHTTTIEGITTISSEMLIILKQGAEIDRGSSIKGKKDAIDILTILIYSGFERSKYRTLIKEFKLEYLEKELERVVKSFDESDLQYIGLDHQQFVNWKKEF